MNAMTRHIDSWSWVVIAITLVLFLVALFLKGLSHDLLLEAGVFLISVKLIANLLVLARYGPILFLDGPPQPHPTPSNRR